ncbi:methylated-DNA-[protein]-cysteine S-methyltransferase [Salipiger thiooxidans]|uniref:Methylated-DNA--protein-cysteine methyltransferase n=1 Tax=Salipiger thiooxidans TaxID=282683 RepID=A0A1G7CWP8_9RHOB|nr:methylated-DNA--[protein]-cysteine S-methyltransferase [Salipiger thiooxidans]SDE43210.1 methylated-DNA-[protein]-cysteine S-methyltransferase [Salipiger thiooxidans]
MTAALSWCHTDSPIGPLLLAGDSDALHFLSFPSGHKAFGPREGWHEDPTPFDAVRRQLDAYFAGTLTRFDLRLAPQGTAFQTRVWQLLAEIPYGTTRSYGALATQLGTPNASRAVGAANGANPIPIILPCHRVIGQDGALTGFGGGVEVKRFLLQHEAEVSGVAETQLSLF